MKRICLKVKSLRLVSLKSDLGEEKTVRATLELGNALNIAGVQAGYEKEGGSFHQNLSMASLRLMDTPFLHRKEKEKNTPLHLLEEIICEAIWFFFKQNEVRMRDLLGQKLDDFDLEEFFPEWNDRELAIPVEFIKLSKFDCRHQNGDVSADIQLGHHFIVWGVKIYDGRGVFELFDENIRSRELRKVIREMIKRNAELQEHVKYLSKHGISDMGEEVFIDKTEGCDPKSLPPPVSFC
ncbi:MAG: hypothetical protein Q8N37_01950 [bacterium]|nr:hypothetical protein [bacterium]